MMAMRQILLGPMGAPTPPPPYDYAVEYIECDWSITRVGDGRTFDLSEYASGVPWQSFSSVAEIKVSFSDVASNQCIGFIYGSSALQSIKAFKPSSSTRVCVSCAGSSATARVEIGDCDLSRPYTIRYVASSGACDFYVDGNYVASKSNGTTSTSPWGSILLFVRQATGAQKGVKARIWSLKIDDAADLIPVVKDGLPGFYNRVDGKIFTSELTYVTAGPRI